MLFVLIKLPLPAFDINSQPSADAVRFYIFSNGLMACSQFDFKLRLS